MKQTKWMEGILLALNSKAINELFAKCSLKLRFRVIRDLLILPFKIENLDANQYYSAQKYVPN